MTSSGRINSVHGWVRNRPDGSVQAVVSGAPPLEQVLIDWAQHGPAQVQGVDVVAWRGEIVGMGFEQLDACCSDRMNFESYLSSAPGGELRSTDDINGPDQ